MRLLSTIVCVGIVLSVLPARAATFGSIRGTVTDAVSDRALSGAVVTLSSSGASYRSVTDARGVYAVEGIAPAAYLVTVNVTGYRQYQQPSVEVDQDSHLILNVALMSVSAPPLVATVTSHSATSPLQPHQPIDVYVVGNREITQLGGVPAFENEATLLNSLPGVSAVGGGSAGLTGSFPTIRGGLENDQGFQLDGINATEPLTGLFINNFILNSPQSVNVTAGPGDASKGGAGSGYVNIVTKTGTYPGTGFVQIEDGGIAYEHNVEFEYGTATPNHRYSLFVGGRYDRDYGGCCSPPFGNTYGSATGAYPDTLGQVSFGSTNDTVANFIYRFGKNQANAIQLWSDWGANHLLGGNGINPSTYPYASGNPLVVSTYQNAPVFVGQPGQLTYNQAQALVPLYPGQTTATQPLGTLPYELTNYNLFKAAFSGPLGERSALNARVYRTQNWVVDNESDGSNPFFGYGLPALQFSDVYVNRATQNTGVAADLQTAFGVHHELSYGGEYRFSRASLNGYLPSPSLFFAGPTIADFLPADPFNPNPSTGLPQPGIFAGQPYPALTELIKDPMYRTSFYVSDNWTPSDRLTIQPGVRWDIQKVPTAAGMYEANSLQPRLAGALTIGADRTSVVRASYGHGTTFAPLFQIENIYNPPAAYHNFPATLNNVFGPGTGICGGTAANFSAPCTDYYDQLANAWWKGFGINPYNFTRPQQSDTYDLSLEHAFAHGTAMKVTVYDRRDYDVIVNSQQITLAPSGQLIPGTIAITNQGKSQTAGVELQVSRQLLEGVSAQFNASYINQFVNYFTSNAFRPSIPPAFLASGVTVHPPYFSPFNATASIEYRHKGWRINPAFTYNKGYPIGNWASAPIIVNGQPVFVPNTNLYGNFNGGFCYYVDPQTPGSPGSPNIVGSTGGGCTPALNSTLTHSVLFTNLAISKDLSNRVLLGLQVQNIFNNTANYPYYNPGYINNGYGAYGPGSGGNPSGGLPGALASYPPQPYFTIPSGPGTQWTIYVRVHL